MVLYVIMGRLQVGTIHTNIKKKTESGCVLATLKLPANVKRLPMAICCYWKELVKDKIVVIILRNIINRPSRWRKLLGPARINEDPGIGPEILAGFQLMMVGRAELCTDCDIEMLGHS